MSWYDEWLFQQLQNLPHSLAQLRVGAYKIQDKQSLNTFFEGIEDYCARETEGVSIDEITEYLRKTGTFDHTKALHGHQTPLIFAALCCTLTMTEALRLYRSSNIRQFVLKCFDHGLIYSFSSIESFPEDPHANEEELTQFLQEVLLSYRLLFAQSAPSKKLFRQIYWMSNFQSHPTDSLLFQLCTQKRIGQNLTMLPADKPLYFAARDFPVLYDRIELMANDIKDEAKLNPQSNERQT
ncbi:unnamed protein product [Penicillium egyptiacum]|uniref:Uncharacterized protein n=1 Tax=Penicillium egyptiacum TaxID=1303716 RepID=A0A9W4KE96_9EURO|nr:unnamed protein product [Penicillium egyptiacum]